MFNYFYLNIVCILFIFFIIYFDILITSCDDVKTIDNQSLQHVIDIDDDTKSYNTF